MPGELQVEFGKIDEYDNIRPAIGCTGAKLLHRLKKPRQRPSDLGEADNGQFIGRDDRLDTCRTHLRSRTAKQGEVSGKFLLKRTRKLSAEQVARGLAGDHHDAYGFRHAFTY